MKTRIPVTWAAVAAVSALLAMPDETFGGRRDWARAGKILTGYVMVRTLIGDPMHPVCVRRIRCVSGPVDACCVSCGRGIHPGGRRARDRVSRPRTPPPGDPPERWVDRGAAAGRAPTGRTEMTEPLVVPLSDGRRLYQSGPAGSSAYVQRWSEADDAWVSVARMPCLR